MLGGFERNLTDFSTDVFQLEPESWLFFSNAEKQLQDSVEPETQALSLTLSTWMTCGDSELKSTSADLIYSGILWIIWDFLILLSCFSWCCSRWELPGNLHLSVTSDIRLGAVDLDSSSLSPLAFSSQSRFDLMNKNVSCEKKELMLTSLLPSWPSALWFWPGVAILMSSGVNASLFDSVVCCKSFHKRQKPARAWESHLMLLIFQMTKVDVGMTKAEVIWFHLLGFGAWKQKTDSLCSAAVSVLPEP